MTQYYKVLWREGMLVGPHHFQQWDHYHERVLELRVKYLRPFSWGVIDMEINTDMLTDCRIFELKSFRGVFPSGMVVDMPEGDAAPVTREITLRDVPHRNNLGVYLAFPLVRTSRSYDCPGDGLGNWDEESYISQYVCVPDENSLQNNLEIAAARKNMKIKLDTCPDLHNYELLKIAELARSNNALSLDKDYIPACLVLTASSRLLDILGDILHKMRSGDPDSFGQSRMKPLLMRYTLNTHIPLLKHFRAVGQVHPEVVFRHLVQLAGQLITLSKNKDVEKLPLYDHEDLAFSFTQLAENILDLLDELSDSSK
jgi:type VI secretion system protein ImpJ